MPTKEKTLEDLFLETLKDVYHAEKQILVLCRKWPRRRTRRALRQAFETHRTETEGQVTRLEQIFEAMGKAARGKPCEAIAGLIEEGKEVMEDFKDSAALDPGLLAGAQAVEHYEISRYGTLKSWANQLGMRDAAKLLDQTLQEEKRTDELLTKLAEASLNAEAV